MSKKLGKLKTFELLDTLNWEFIREYIILNQSIEEEKDEEIKLILDCIKKDARIAELEKQLAEKDRLLENAIVPKFNFGDTIFAVVTYIDDPKDKTVIESGIVQKIGCDKNQIKYWCDNGRIYWEDECEKLFATKEEAEKALKELEGK